MKGQDAGRERGAARGQDAARGRGRDAAREIETLAEWVRACPAGGMVFFGGAGVSTESGIPDFRSSDGVYMQLEGMAAAHRIPPEQIISHSFFMRHPREFYDFYCNMMLFPDAQPNAAHRALSALERQGTLNAVVTQNIDGLHEAAGSSRVFDLHGSVHRNHCMRCNAFCDMPGLLRLREASRDGVPHCAECGGIVKPDVVLYEEGLDEDVLGGALHAIERASLLVIAGTSLVVNPAASLVRFFRGEHLAVINLSETPADAQADLCIHAKVGEVFAAIGLE